MSIDTTALRAAVDLVSVVGSRLPLTKQGHEFKALCPFHEEATPSFYVIPDKNFCYCHGCGWDGDAIQFLMDMDGISFKDACKSLCEIDFKALPISAGIPQKREPRQLWQSEKPPAHCQEPETFDTVRYGPALKVWTYRNADGDVLGYVARYEIKLDDKVEKHTPTWSYGKTDGPLQWAMKRWTRPYPLYGLDRLAAKPTSQVIIVEGEKTADAAQVLFPASVAVTWVGGAQCPQHADWTPLYGRNVIVIPDADKDGREAARWIMALLATNHCQVKWIDPEPTRPKGWDLADGLADGWSHPVALQWAKDHLKTYAPTMPAEPPVTQATPMPNPPNNGGAPVNVPVDPPASQEPVKPRKSRQKGNLALVGPPETPSGTPPQPPEPEEAVPPAFSDDAIAARCAVLHGNNWRNLAGTDRWLHWNGAYWETDDRKGSFALIRQVCREIVNYEQGALLSEPAKRGICSDRTVAAVRRMLSSDPTIATSRRDWNLDRWILATPAGTIDLKTGTLRPSRREDSQTFCTAVAPAEMATPIWTAFLERVTDGNTELQDYLQRLVGYAMTGVTDEQMLAFFYGTGANGKSVFLNTVRALLCINEELGYACGANVEIFSETKNEPHPTVYARLDKKRLVIALETEDGKRWSEAKIKAFTGGDLIQARKMCQDEYEYQPTFKLIFAGNHKPSLRSVDEAMRRRVHIVPWLVTIPEKERDHKLEDKLRAEWPGILQWMIAGCVAWQQQGLNAPEIVKAATDEYLEVEDALGDWLEENCQLGEQYETTVAEVYRNYLDYCEKIKEHPWSKKRMLANLQTRGIERTRSMGIRCWKGIGLKAGVSEAQGREW